MVIVITEVKSPPVTENKGIVTVEWTSNVVVLECKTYNTNSQYVIDSLVWYALDWQYMWIAWIGKRLNYTSTVFWGKMSVVSRVFPFAWKQITAADDTIECVQKFPLLWEHKHMVWLRNIHPLIRNLGLIGWLWMVNFFLAVAAISFWVRIAFGWLFNRRYLSVWRLFLK